jgi:hypothetical protein
MVMPTVNFNFSTSKFSFFAGITLSYLTHVGWWAIDGLIFLLYSEAKGWARLSCLFILVAALVLAVFKTGWRVF